MSNLETFTIELQVGRRWKTRSMLFLLSTKIQATFDKHEKYDISGVFVVFATTDKNIFAALVLN